jgi:HlyD family secretion protein
MAKKKSGKRKGLIITLIIIIVLGGAGTYLFMQAAKNTGPTFEVRDVVKSTIEINVNGSGVIESYDNETIYVSYTSEVKDVNAENGDIVSKGDIIATLESDSLDSEILQQKATIESLEKQILYMTIDSSTYISTKAKGRVKAVYVKEDEKVDSVMGKYGSLAVISTDDMLKAIIAVDDIEIYDIGSEVDIKIGDIVLIAIVDEINPTNQSIKIVFEDDKDEDYMLGDAVHLINKLEQTIAQGELQANHPFYITAVGGVIETINYEANEYIYEGDTIFKREESVFDEDYLDAIDDLDAKRKDLIEMQAAKRELVVRAPMDGIVQNFSINEGQFINQGFVICDIEGNAMLKILVDIDELDIAKIKLGQNATVTMDALEEKEYTANVTKISPVGVSINNVTSYTVTLELESYPEILLGMSAEVDILAQKLTDVVTVPIEAIQTIDNAHYVMMASDIGLQEVATHKIEIGLSDGVNAEVIEGLSDGDQVAVLVEFVDPRAMMMGGPPGNPEDFE